MKKYLGLRGSKLSAAIWAEACLGVMIFGYNQGAAGGVLSMKNFNDRFPEMNTISTTGAKQAFNSKIQGTVVALYTLLGAFGALGCTILGDILGRRKTIFLSNAVQAIGAILEATSFQFAQFIVARIVLGLGTGGIIATVSVWQSEVSKAESRGEHVSAFGIFAGLGLVMAMWVSFGMSFTQPSSASWRFTLILPLFLSVLVAATIFFLPESPRWLCKKDRWQEAQEILSLVHGADPDGEVISKEMNDIRQSFERASHGGSNIREMFTMGPQRCFHRVVIGATAQMILQMSGINALVYYESIVFQQQLKLSAIESGILSAASMTCLVLGSICCAFTVDRFGRRMLMLVSATGMMVCFACMAGVTSNPNNHAALRAGIFFIYFYLFLYCIGFLGIPFLYASEIAPTHLRAAAAGVSTASSWLFNFLIAEVTPVAFVDIGWRYFIVFACLNAGFVTLIFFFFPETARLSLEEIDEIFQSSKSIFDTVNVAKRIQKRRLKSPGTEEISGHTEIKATEAEHHEKAEGTGSDC